MRGIDYSFARPDPAQIKGAGYDFVARYLGYGAKAINRQEADALLAAGLRIVLVWETYADRALSGFAGGHEDAQAAYSQAQAVGQPTDRPIYFAVDFDAYPSQQAVIDDYLRGAASVLGAERVGIYGSYYVCARCQSSGSAHWFWQTLAWSGGQQFAGHIYQDGGQAFDGGADTDVALAADFGQWPISQPQPEEDDMFAPLFPPIYQDGPNAVECTFWFDNQLPGEQGIWVIIDRLRKPVQLDATLPDGRHYQAGISSVDQAEAILVFGDHPEDKDHYFGPLTGRMRLLFTGDGLTPDDVTVEVRVL